MTEIDLHGFKHDEVEDKLANLLILHYNMGNFPVRQLLKEEVFRLTKRGKPAPRKRRNWKKKPVKK
jgi:hypothetical protein